MARCMVMFAGMLVLGRVAAADMPADQADAQVNPGIAHFQTILTAVGAGRHVPNLIDMRTLVCHLTIPFAQDTD